MFYNDLIRWMSVANQNHLVTHELLTYTLKVRSTVKVSSIIKTKDHEMWLDISPLLIGSGSDYPQHTEPSLTKVLPGRVKNLSKKKIILNISYSYSLPEVSCKGRRKIPRVKESWRELTRVGNSWRDLTRVDENGREWTRVDDNGRESTRVDES